MVDNFAFDEASPKELILWFLYKHHTEGFTYEDYHRVMNSFSRRVSEVIMPCRDNGTNFEDIHEALGIFFEEKPSAFGNQSPLTRPDFLQLAYVELSGIQRICISCENIKTQSAVLATGQKVKELYQATLS
jgi:hypothetical protein